MRLDDCWKYLGARSIFRRETVALAGHSTPLEVRTGGEVDGRDEIAGRRGAWQSMGEDGRLRVRMGTSAEEVDCCGGWILDAKDVRRVRGRAETQEPSVANWRPSEGADQETTRRIK